ncbi:MAG: hypothetical protein WHV44_06690 [Anaerolineales bacterium]
MRGSNDVQIWQEPKLLSRLVGRGRRRYVVLGLLVFTSFSLLNAMSLFFEIPQNVLRLVFVIFLIGLFLNLGVSLRVRYWRDIMLWRATASVAVVLQSFITGSALIFTGGGLSFFLLVLIGVLVSTFLAFRSNQRGVQQFELARRKGFLKRYLDEKSWTYDDDPAKASEVWLAIQKAGDETKAKGAVKWLRRLEKLHVLIPGIAIAFRRAFGHEDIVIGIFLLVFGLLFTDILLSSSLSYLKIREWEKVEGKPVLLRFVWEKEQQRSGNPRQEAG